MKTLILNIAQAQAVYSAMCALNNILGRIDVQMSSARVKEYANGVVVVTQYGAAREDYDNQSAFAAAYNLDL